jgi:4'-phosphopantetheinyl transferase EntD
VCWDRLLFCAKEAVFKAWFPLAGSWLDFADASIEFDPATATFAARLLVEVQATDGWSGRFTGRWLVRDGLVITAIAAAATPRRCLPECHLTNQMNVLRAVFNLETER